MSVMSCYIISPGREVEYVREVYVHHFPCSCLQQFGNVCVSGEIPYLSVSAV